jgi:Putative transmembrane protein (PGPGW)
MNFQPGHPLAITYKWARRIVIAVVGFTVLGVGVAMIVLPGPAIVVIPVGLGILGLEFAWARHWLHKIRERGEAVWRVVKKSPQSTRSPQSTVHSPQPEAERANERQR